MNIPIDFLEKIVTIIENGRRFVGRTTNLAMCITYFEVGRMIVEEEQNGKERAEYGKTLIKELSKYLSGCIGKGFSETNLKNARLFYQTYSSSIHQTLSDELKKAKSLSIRQTLSDEFNDHSLFTSALQLNDIFKLSWSHYLFLTKIKYENERIFYEIKTVAPIYTGNNI